MPTGKGRRPAPPGYMSAADAGKLLGESRIYKLVDADRLHRYTPPGMQHGYYAESEVQKIQAEDKAFYEEKLHKVPARFAYARPSDMQSLYALAVRIFGGSTITAETRADWIRAERRGNYVMKRPDTGEVVAYFYLQALSHARILEYLKECRGSTIRPEEILSIEPGHPIELIVAGIGRDPRSDRQLAGALLHGVAQDLARWGEKGIEISKLYAYSETTTGIFLSFSMGMELWKRPRYIDNEGPFFTFVLDVEKSNTPLLKPYKQAIAQYRRAHGQEKTIAPTEHTLPTPRMPRQKAASPDQHTIWSQEHITANEPVHSDMPDGLIGLAEYAKLKGIPETTLKKAASSGRIPVVTGTWKKGKAIVRIALDEAGRAKVQELYGVNQSPAPTVWGADSAPLEDA